MPNDKIDKLNKLLELVQNDTITPKEIEQFLLMVVGIVRKTKDNFEQLSEKKLAEIQEIVEQILAEHQDILDRIEQSNEVALSSVDKKIAEIRAFAEEVKKIRATPGKDGQAGAPGKDADEERIIEQVTAKVVPTIVLPDDSGEAIVEKINDLPIDNPEYLIDAKHIKNFPLPKGFMAGGSRYISQMVDGQYTNTASIEYVIDGGGSAITTGIKGDLEIPFNCTIQSWTLLGDQSGSIVIDVWKDTFVSFPPTGGDSITASAKPTLSSQTSNQSSTLTGWTTSIAAGDILRFNVDSAATITRATLSLKVIKT